jgi:hypothetical protein
MKSGQLTPRESPGSDCFPCFRGCQSRALLIVRSGRPRRFDLAGPLSGREFCLNQIEWEQCLGHFEIERTPARRLQRQENKESAVNQEVHSDREANGGKLTAGEKAKVSRQQDKMSRQIYKDKHNGAKAKP